jgi:hypothetical protein
MSLGNKILLVIWFCVGLYGGLRIFDGVFLDSYYLNKIKYGSECSFHTPNGYQIYYSELKQKYAVRVLQYGSDYYLTGDGWDIFIRLSEIQSPTLFDDSCEAKAYLKAFIIDTKPKFE